MKREEIERAVEALFAVSCADEGERAEIVRALEARVQRVAVESERLDRTHSLVRLMLSAIPALGQVRHLALDVLRKQAEADGDPDRWSHGTVARRLGITRASAATIAHGPRGKMLKG